MARGHMIADAVAIIGTQDIVFGEVDVKCWTTDSLKRIDREIAKYPPGQKKSAVMSAL